MIFGCVKILIDSFLIYLFEPNFTDSCWHIQLLLTTSNNDDGLRLSCSGCDFTNFLIKNVKKKRRVWHSWWKSQYWLKALYFIFSLSSLRFNDVYRHDSGRCHNLPFLTFFIIKKFVTPPPLVQILKNEIECWHNQITVS